jgi:condensin complex subunit 1
MKAGEFSQDTSGVKNIATFIGDLAERLPAMVLPNVSLLLTHLDGEVRERERERVERE